MQHSMWFEASHGIVSGELKTPNVVSLAAYLEGGGARTLLAHAYGDILGGLMDFRDEIVQARTVDEAHEIALWLHELIVKAQEFENLALNMEDVLNGGTAA